MGLLILQLSRGITLVHGGGRAGADAAEQQDAEGGEDKARDDFVQTGPGEEVLPQDHRQRAQQPESQPQPLLGELRSSQVEEQQFTPVQPLAEGGAERLINRRIAADGAERVGGKRIVEGGAERVGNRRIAEGGAERLLRTRQA